MFTAGFVINSNARECIPSSRRVRKFIMTGRTILAKRVCIKKKKKAKKGYARVYTTYILAGVYTEKKKKMYTRARITSMCALLFYDPPPPLVVKGAAKRGKKYKKTIAQIS